MFRDAWWCDRCQSNGCQFCGAPWFEEQLKLKLNLEALPQSFVTKLEMPGVSMDQDMKTLAHYRRRCAWCGVQLRWWQLNMCRRCKRARKYNNGLTEYRQATRWYNFPDGRG